MNLFIVNWVSNRTITVCIFMRHCKRNSIAKSLKISNMIQTRNPQKLIKGCTTKLYPPESYANTNRNVYVAQTFRNKGFPQRNRQCRRKKLHVLHQQFLYCVVHYFSISFLAILRYMFKARNFLSGHLQKKLITSPYTIKLNFSK